MFTHNHSNPIIVDVPYKTQKFFATFCLLGYLLNCIDAIFTCALLKTGVFREINPILNPYLPQPVVAILSKIILPAIVFTILFFRLGHTKKRELTLGKYTLLGICFFYFLIDCSHIIYIFLFL